MTRRGCESRKVMRPRGKGLSGRERETIQKVEVRATMRAQKRSPGAERRSGSKSIKCPVKTFSALYKISTSFFIRLCPLAQLPASLSQFREYFSHLYILQVIFSNSYQFLIYFKSDENFLELCES